MNVAMMAIHILGGSIALFAGAGALAVRKGGPWHARLGTAFFLSMLVMTSTGAVIAALMPERGTMLVGILTCYLVATAWVAARHRSGQAGTFERVALLVALGCAVGQFVFGYWALQRPGGRLDLLPYQAHLIFGALAALAATLDLNMILRKRIGAGQRIVRHLWRMSAALVIAASSFFQGQQDEFPEAVRGSPLWYLPPLLALAALGYWVVRIRFGAGLPARKRPVAEPGRQSSLGS